MERIIQLNNIILGVRRCFRSTLNVIPISKLKMTYLKNKCL